MLELLFPRAHVRFSSLPILGGALEGLCVWLDARGLSREAIQRRMEAAKRLVRVLRRRRVRSLSELSASALLACVPPRGTVNARPLGALVRSLAQYLGERGELVVTPPSPSERLLAAFGRYLESVRGLAASTIAMESVVVTEFLRFLDHDAQPHGLAALCGAQVEAFVVEVCKHRSRSWASQVTMSLRTFLRFLAARQEVAPGLHAHVESPRIWRGEHLPRALAWDTVCMFLQSIDRTAPKGRRDYAMFLLIATYGLRRSEVAALRLDDVSWRHRQIRVPRPKVGTPLLLPLTDEVETSLVAYLRRDRPVCTDRALFLRVELPVGPLQGGAVTAAFRTWARRAGILLPPRGGPHSLRHALAIHLLQEGTALKAIGDLLGHRCVATTGLYLRLDLAGLREVALPLPSTPATAEVQR